jgi:hypothetical protein
LLGFDDDFNSSVSSELRTSIPYSSVVDDLLIAPAYEDHIQVSILEVLYNRLQTVDPNDIMSFIQETTSANKTDKDVWIEKLTQEKDQLQQQLLTITQEKEISF